MGDYIAVVPVRPLRFLSPHNEYSAYPNKRLLISCWFSSIYEFQKEFPSWNFLVPREELFSSSGGTFQFQRRNFLVPAEELLGGRALGRGLRVSEWK